MPIAPTTVERAFEMARDGSCNSMDEITRALKRERFDDVDAALKGQSLRIQLRTVMMEGRLKRLGRRADPAV